MIKWYNKLNVKLGKLRSKMGELGLPLFLWRGVGQVWGLAVATLIDAFIIPRYEDQLGTFLEFARDCPGDSVVLFFTGTPHITETYGLRPMRQAEALLKKEVPVFYSYYRWNRTGNVVDNREARLFQSPVDLTLDKLDRVVEADLGNKRKYFIVSLPLVAVGRRLEELHTHGWRTIYDVHDDWEAFAAVGQSAWYSESVERYFVNTAMASCCVAEPLREKIQSYTDSRTVALNPNAYDPGFLARDSEGRLAPREGEKIAGYFGHMTPSWFDWDCLNEVARLLPNWTFEVVGRGRDKRITLEPNIKVYGPHSHAELNERAQRWRVAMICFKMGPLADGVDPIKIYEYLALGLPTVSLRMPQTEDYPYVYQATSADGFAKRIEMASTVAMERDKIDGFLERNTWDVRVDDMLELVRDRPPDMTELEMITSCPM